MMPQTVPNSPTNGAVEPIVASELEVALQQLDLAVEGQGHDLADPLEQRAAPLPAAGLRRFAPLLHGGGEQHAPSGGRRRGRGGGRGRPAARRTRTRARTRCALRRRRASRKALSKITAQDQIEARTRTSRTPLTTGSACVTSDQRPRPTTSSPARRNAVMAFSSMARSYPCVHDRHGGPAIRQRGSGYHIGKSSSVTTNVAAVGRSQRTRSRSLSLVKHSQRSSPSDDVTRRPFARPRSRVERGDAARRGRRATREVAATSSARRTSRRASEPSRRSTAAAPARARRRRGAASRVSHLEQVVEPRRRPVVDRAAAHREHQAEAAAQAGVVEPEAAQHLGARALGELEIGGVVDDAGGIGVLVVDADAAGGGRPPSMSPDRSSPTGRHGIGRRTVRSGRPGSRRRLEARCCQARRVSRRPRGVRCSRPCCSR